ncbi:MAG: hypothetical protein IKP05_00855 [Alphaproteobacteria bacterium]|nr:hypothetical protein [Alphaproteobacteria bacterium]
MISDKESLIKVPVEFTNTVLRVASVLNVRDMCVVGGAVRDCVLGAVSGHTTRPKDLDVILPEPLSQPHKNPNVLGIKKNSLGGTKVYVKNFGTVDVFQQYTNEPESIIANYFDFNCNSLYYRMHDNTIQPSAFFLEFLESRTIREQNMAYTNGGINGMYGLPQTVMRALKFQILFSEKYNLEIDLSDDLLYQIYNMKTSDEREMKKYMASHVMDKKLQTKILASYQKIRG